MPSTHAHGSSTQSLDGSGAGPTPDTSETEGRPRVGWFRYYFDDDRWEWSPEVQRMHGYEPGRVTPTTELILSHKHRDDYRQIADTLEVIRQKRQAFRSRHRIIDVHGKVHHVAVLGDELHDDGRVIGTYGFYVDLTPEEQARQRQVTEDVAQVLANRTVIDEAKGMLMLVYNIDAEAAFELLKWRSQEANVKLRQLAEQIVADFTRVAHNGEMPARAVYDNLFLTTHQRIKRSPRRASAGQRKQ
jgi:PAS domain S-box-containing protein